MATTQTQNNNNNNNNDTALKKLQDPYVDIMRQKIGEFMLIHNDLEETRGVALEPIFNRVINASDSSTPSKDITTIKDMAVNIIQSKTNKSTSEHADHHSIVLLHALLFNNGFPCQIIIDKLKNQDTTTTYIDYIDYIDHKDHKDIDNDARIYHMHVLLAGANGEAVDSPNHYTFSIPSDMNIQIPTELNDLLNEITTSTENKNTTGDMKKYNTLTDGHCFYRAIANWCIIYGITVDHLKNMTYNIPFTASKEHFQQNLKVPTSTTRDIPKPIEFPKDEFLKFKKDALIIAQNMKKKITQEDFKPTFEEDFKDITKSKEYKEYTNKIANDPTHCKKYKGNKETKVEGTGN
jgi:hypothetical protein